MDKSCFNCISFPKCPILRKAREGEYDELDELFVYMYGKYCIDFRER